MSWPRAGIWSARWGFGIITASRRETSSGCARTRARAAAAIVLTTEKDAVRLEGSDLGDLTCGSRSAILTGVEPAERFRDWLLDRVR